MSFNIGNVCILNTMLSSSLWQRFQQYFLYYRDLGFSLDISRMKFPDDFFEKMQPKIFCTATNRPTINFRTPARILETKAEYGGPIFRRSN